MLKMFMAAGGMSALVFAAWRLGVFGKGGRSSFHAASDDFTSGLRSKSTATVAAGASMLGAGMAIAGACPGMVLIQVGSGVQNSVYTFAGCIVGAYCAETFHHQPEAGGKAAAAAAAGTSAGAGLLFNTPTATLLLGAVLFGVAIGADVLRPWTDDVDEDASALWFSGHFGVGSAFYISPVLAGALVGALQLAAVGLFQDTLGSATSYVHGLSYVCGHGCFERFQKPGFTTAWQLPYVIGAIGGGFASAMAAGTVGSNVGLPPLKSFVGGLLLLYGSRLAGGCTSGHGLSGLALGSLHAWVAVPAMFGGGIATAFAMKAAGLFVDCTDNCAW